MNIQILDEIYRFYGLRLYDLTIKVFFFVFSFAVYLLARQRFGFLPDEISPI